MLAYTAIFVIDLIHIFLLMRFCTNCIGTYRINKKRGDQLFGFLYCQLLSEASSCFKKIFSRKYKSVSAGNPILIWHRVPVSGKSACMKISLRSYGSHRQIYVL